jgi:hypothetical protein
LRIEKSCAVRNKLIWSSHDFNRTATGMPAGPRHRLKGTTAMLLLINRRYPVLAAILGAIASLTFIAIGVTSAHALMIGMGAVSLALSAVRMTHQFRPRTSQARS